MIEINLTLELFQVKSLRLLGYQRLIEYSWNNILQVSGGMVGKCMALCKNHDFAGIDDILG